MYNTKYGYWTVYGQKFIRKYDALLHASKISKPVKFYYHNSIWNNFDRSLLGKTSLNQLYKERAQQLRDNYKYLILYYSGGADSHNILRTFIDNNIKLDEICIKWPKTLMDGNFYTANTKDTGARNYWSEWDYAIKPVLEWLGNNKPEIKITFKDYTESIQNLNLENVFEKLNFIRGGAILMNSVISDIDKEDSAHIYGIDKPLLFTADNKLYMFFTDLCLDQAGRSEINPYNTECFYWTPDLPLLPFEQAYQLGLYYKANPDKQQFLWNDTNNTGQSRTICNQMQNNLAKQVLYTTWDYRFQADKPDNNGNRTDKFFWFYEHPELERVRQKYFYNVDARINMIDNTLLTAKTGTVPSVYNITSSTVFYVMDL